MIQAEYAVIGGVLIDNSALSEIIDLKPDMFDNEICRDAFREMLAMYDRNEEITPMSLGQKMDNNKYDAETYNSFFVKAVTDTVTSASTKHYAKVVMAEWRARTAKKLMLNTDFKPGDIDDTIGHLITALEALQNNTENPVHSMKQIVAAYSEEYFTDKRGGGVKTGFNQLDECLGSLSKKNVTVIAARPKVGKSAFSTQLVTDMARTGVKVAYFNLEMSEQEIYERMVSRLSNVKLERVTRAVSFLNDEKQKFDDANTLLSKLPLDIISGAQTVSRVKALSKNQGYDLIVIDYMQLLGTEKAYGNRASEVSQISADIKRMAMDLNTHVIALSQLNRTHAETKEPQLEDLRESGAIEQDASNIIMLWNLSENDRRLKGLKVAKNRQGIEMKWGYEFDGAHMEFRERGKYADVLKEAQCCDQSAFTDADDGEIPF